MTASSLPATRSSLPFLVPMATAFLASTCFMMIEIVAGRLVTMHFGTSIYTWTSVIGICLAGMSLGNYIGGRLADRVPSKILISTLLLAASMSCALIPLVNNLLKDSLIFYRLQWSTQIAAHVAAVFFIPTVLMSTISPVVTKMALDVGLARGRTVGSVYAVSTLGAITGTFFAGFFIIAAVGSQATIWLTGGLMAVAAILFLPKRPMPIAWLALFAGLAFAALSPLSWATAIGVALSLRTPASPDTIYEDESQYSYIAIVKAADDASGEASDMRHFILDKLDHSYMIMGRPLDLQYDYEQIYAAVVRRCVDHPAFRSLAIGGGGYVFPHYLTLVYPESEVAVVEIDPRVTLAAHEAFGLPRDARLDIHHMDARNYVEAQARKKRQGRDVPSYDFIFADAFNDFSVPFHLTTREFTENITELLTPQGVYLVNIVDRFQEGRFLGALLNTFRTCFDQVYVFSAQIGGSTRTAPRDTFIIVCANRDLDLTDLRVDQDPTKPLPYPQLTSDQLDHLAERSGGLVLTDDYAPVENLLSAVAQTAAAPVYKVLELRAHELTQKGSFPAAIAKYREALQANPDCFTCLINLGILLQQHATIDQAIPVFQKARDLQPDHPVPHYNLAVAWEQAGQPDRAFALYQKSVEVDPQYAQGHAKLGNLYFRRKEHAKAADHYQKSLAGQPDAPTILNNLAAALVQLDKPDEALAAYQKALDLNPNYPRCLINLGNLHKAQGRIGPAKAAYQKALALEPRNTDIQKLLRQLDAGAGQEKK